MALVSRDDIETFQRDGVLLVRGLFSGWVESLRAGVDRNLAEPGADGKLYHDAAGRLFMSDYCNWARIGQYEEFLRHSPCAELAAALMGSQTARLFHEHVLVKEAGAEIATPWHHDQPYYCVDGRQNCSVWVPLDPVARDTSVEFVAGSHRWERFFRPERFNKQALYGDDDAYEPLPDIEGNRADYDIRGFDLEPGDAICFHFLTVHGAPGNASLARSRRAVSARWIGDDARFASRLGRTSPPFRDVTLQPGDIMDAPEFPLLWPRAA
ncbi:MAG: phytanoyl-CoA dioxygenase family protein [Proteobacteria bacterium]|nr:phytanoyl-CoA dioxygenase family protein [Pseudomonadota bacterium]MDA1071020.1 phytanoyl-CoA dioxygenase family protein [Pseudomonadota bacterium]